MAEQNETTDPSKRPEVLEAARLLTLEDVAALIGVAPKTIYNWVNSRRIPHVKPSRSLVRFRLPEILAWIEERSVPERGTQGSGGKGHSAPDPI